MSLHLITGRPGGGKSYYATKLVIEELARGNRLVVTNLPLNLPVLNEYLQEEFPKVHVNLAQRLRLLSDEEVKEFYRFRYAVEPIPMDGADAKKALPRFETIDGDVDRGVLYCLDEVHLFFNARRWTETGHAVTFYLSQHRKLGDDVLGVTQHIAKLDKQFRLDAQDYTYLRNLGKEKWFSLFAGIKRFVRATYLDPFTGQPGQSAMDVAVMKLNPRLAACYDTSRGVGLMGRADADTQRKTKGLPWWGIIVILAIIAVLVFMIPRFFSIAFMGLAVPKTEAIITAPITEGQDSGATHQNASNRILEPPISAEVVKSDVPTVWITGYTRFGDTVRVILSDGRILGRGQLKFHSAQKVITREGDVYEAQPYHITKAKRAASASVVLPSTGRGPWDSSWAVPSPAP